MRLCSAGARSPRLSAGTEPPPGATGPTPRPGPAVCPPQRRRRLPRAPRRRPPALRGCAGLGEGPRSEIRCSAVDCLFALLSILHLRGDPGPDPGATSRGSRPDFAPTLGAPWGAVSTPRPAAGPPSAPASCPARGQRGWFIVSTRAVFQEEPNIPTTSAPHPTLGALCLRASAAPEVVPERGAGTRSRAAPIGGSVP